MNRSCDIVIVGTGVAGLFCALNLPRSMQVTIITKRSCDQSDSFLAQGGICVLPEEGDFESFFEDVLCAGHYENDHDAVRTMIAQSQEVIGDLVRLGVDFNRRPDGSLDYTREAAHSRPRIVFHKDITGFEVSSVLLRAVRALPNVRIIEDTTMIDIIEEDGRCVGVVACASAAAEGVRGQVDTQAAEAAETQAAEPFGAQAADATVPFVIRANAVVLACGGVGGLFRCSTNYPHIRGEALAIAHRHGVALKNLDYVQIHPTSLYSKRPGRSFLISESVRGEGACLYGKDGKRFTDELQPRDLLTKAIRQQMQADGTEFVWEDLRPLGRDVILSHFPNICQRCLEEGYDVLTEPIPVTPAQHYFMGGIKVDLESRTSLPGLYACGEISCNGVHGRNRLASNSLLESLVFSKRAAKDIAGSLGTDGEEHAAAAPSASGHGAAALSGAPGAAPSGTVSAAPSDSASTTPSAAPSDTVSDAPSAAPSVASSDATEAAPSDSASTTPSAAPSVDLAAYGDPASLLRAYADTVLSLMEEDRSRHE